MRFNRVPVTRADVWATFDVHVTGRGGHGAYPHLSIDPITAAATILVGMQNLVSREVAAQETDVGLVNYIEGTATVPLESVAVVADADGRVVVTTGVAPQG